MAVPKRYEMEILKEKDLEVGSILIIVDEFTPNHPVLTKSFLGGTVQMEDDVKKLLSLNKTSYDCIKEVYGEDTNTWIGKVIVYDGMQKCGKAGTMMGKIFKPEV